MVILSRELPRTATATGRLITGEFVLAVASAAETADLALVEAGVAKVIGALRSLVPEEGADIAAVLPRRLRQLWGDPAGVIGQGLGEAFVHRHVTTDSAGNGSPPTS